MYIAGRPRGSRGAEEMLADLHALQSPVRHERAKDAGCGRRIKAEFTLSYADAFAVGLAQELDATLVTGDGIPMSRAAISTLRLPQK